MYAEGPRPRGDGRRTPTAVGAVAALRRRESRELGLSPPGRDGCRHPGASPDGLAHAHGRLVGCEHGTDEVHDGDPLLESREVERPRGGRHPGRACRRDRWAEAATRARVDRRGGVRVERHAGRRRTSGPERQQGDDERGGCVHRRRRRGRDHRRRARPASSPAKRPGWLGCHPGRFGNISSASRTTADAGAHSRAERSAGSM